MKILFCTLWIGLMASNSLAQDAPRFELFVGSSFLREPSVDTDRYGWVWSLSTNVNNWLGVKGEVGGYYGAFYEDVHSFMGGPQFNWRRSSRVEPWAHFLMGVQRFHDTTPTPLFGTAVAQFTHFAIQPGGGVDVSLNSRLGLRFGVDYVRALRDSGVVGGVEIADRNNYRAEAGVVFKFPPN
jgi:hypothetical protein